MLEIIDPIISPFMFTSKIKSKIIMFKKVVGQAQKNKYKSLLLT